MADARRVQHPRRTLHRLRRLARVNRFDGTSRSKFGRAQFGWRKRLPQLQAEIPDPLGEDLGKLLAARGMRIPSVGFLLVVFIGLHGLERAAMQIQHIRGRKRGGKEAC
jgi:hypothetical protein